MILPKVISKASLRGLAPTDAHAVRVVLQEVANSGPYRLRCRNREYIFTRDAVLGRHTLEIPISVWMYGVASRSIKAICDDFRTGSGPPFSIHIAQIGESAGVIDVFAANALDQVRLLLSCLGAPDEVVKAFDFIDQRDLTGLIDHVAHYTVPATEAPEQSDIGPDTEEANTEAAGETKAQAQARKMREAKAAKKAAIQPA